MSQEEVSRILPRSISPPHENADTQSGLLACVSLCRLQSIHVGDVDGHHLGLSRLCPSECCGRGHSALACHLDIASSSNEFARSMVIFALESRRGSHDLMMIAFPSGSQ